jgi:hypothetical protein
MLGGRTRRRGQRRRRQRNEPGQQLSRHSLRSVSREVRPCSLPTPTRHLPTPAALYHLAPAALQADDPHQRPGLAQTVSHPSVPLPSTPLLGLRISYFRRLHPTITGSSFLVLHTGVHGSARAEGSHCTAQPQVSGGPPGPKRSGALDVVTAAGTGPDPLSVISYQLLVARAYTTCRYCAVSLLRT